MNLVEKRYKSKENYESIINLETKETIFHEEFKSSNRKNGFVFVYN